MLESIVILILLSGAFQHLSLAVDMDQEQLPQEKYLASLMQFHNLPCTGSTGALSREGVCLGRLECSSMGGTSLGVCGVLGVCCAVERTCYNSTSLKVSYFVGSAKTETLCNYNVELSSPAVCQIRLDFEVFVLAQPTISAPSTLDDPEYTPISAECQADKFTVGSAMSRGTLALCGVNTGQHMYVPVNSTMGVSSISLNLQLGDASDATYLGGASGASWRIKITQLECGVERNYTLLPSPGGNLNYRDTDKIAPPGCLQYYSSRHGTYSSFNYGGLYLSNLDYAICFKRDPDACAIRHTFDHFGLAALNQTDSTDVNAYYDEVCYSSQSGLVVGDYLYIPLAQINSTSTTATQFCGVTLNGYSATSRAPGPFYVYFHSEHYRHSLANVGFHASYSISTC